MLNLKLIGSEKDPPKEQYLISVDQMIGKGSFGKVYLAYNCEDFNSHKLSNPICAKEIPRAIISDSLVKSIRNEAKIQLSNRSHRVLQMYAMKQTASNVYFFLEYCPEGDLRQLLLRNELTESQVVYLFGQIASALRELKQQGVFHRDLKPENILLKEGQIKIADFGFSKIVQESTKNNTQVGTPLYMSPQALSSDQYDLERNDVWSAGCLLYEMIFRTVPWKLPANNQTISALYTAITTQQVVFPKNPQISGELKELINLMLELDEEGRLDWDDILNKEIIKKSQSNRIKDEIKQMNADILEQKLNLSLSLSQSPPIININKAISTLDQANKNKDNNISQMQDKYTLSDSNNNNNRNQEKINKLDNNSKQQMQQKQNNNRQNEELRDEKFKQVLDNNKINDNLKQKQKEEMEKLDVYYDDDFEEES